MASDPVGQESQNLLKREEACPICHENLRNQKMVFQCGHSTCCKCNYLTHTYIYSLLLSLCNLFEPSSLCLFHRLFLHDGARFSSRDYAKVGHVSNM